MYYNIIMFCHYIYIALISKRFVKLSFDEKSKLFSDDLTDTWRPSNFRVNNIV